MGFLGDIGRAVGREIKYGTKVGMTSMAKGINTDKKMPEIKTDVKRSAKTPSGFLNLVLKGSKVPEAGTKAEGFLRKPQEKLTDETLFKDGKNIKRDQLSRDLEARKKSLWGELYKVEKIHESDVRKLGEKWFDEKKYGQYIDKNEVRIVEKEMDKDWQNASGHDKFVKEAELKQFRNLFIKKK